MSGAPAGPTTVEKIDTPRPQEPLKPDLGPGTPVALKESQNFSKGGPMNRFLLLSLVASVLTMTSFHFPQADMASLASTDGSMAVDTQIVKSDVVKKNTDGTKIPEALRKN